VSVHVDHGLEKTKEKTMKKLAIFSAMTIAALMLVACGADSGSGMGSQRAGRQGMNGQP